MKGTKKQHEETQKDLFVVMDNGRRFYWRVIGITPLSLKSKKRRSSRT